MRRTRWTARRAGSYTFPMRRSLSASFDPRDALSGLVEGAVLVDNDVNWEARAERAFNSLLDSDNFVYLHLGEGLGCAVVCDGEVWRGHSGVAGEIAHMLTVGPDGRAIRLTEVFAALGLRQSGSTAVDTELLRAAIALSGGDVLNALAAAVSGVLSATIALADPGSWWWVVPGAATRRLSTRCAWSSRARRDTCRCRSAQ